jgi:two-component system, cell cycle response regulator DivK
MSDTRHNTWMVKKVLVADDEPDARALLRYYLENRGFEVVEAAEGYDALDKAIKHRPDVIFMDMAMPLMDGVNATRAIRENESTREIPIVCVTAHGAFYDPRAREAGCREVLHKPVDFSKLDLLLEDFNP